MQKYDICSTTIDLFGLICIGFTKLQFGNNYRKFAKKTVPRFFLQLQYNGSRYHGWQTQHNALGVQTVVEKCLSFKLNEKIAVTGCGRTDTGVHARLYFAHFDTVAPAELVLSDQFLFQLNTCLPNDIVADAFFEVQEHANARFDAVSRTYHYYLSLQKDPFQNDRSLYVFGNLDVEQMQQCADLLIEYKDFTSFSKLHSQTKTNLCQVVEAQFLPWEKGLVFKITADRFLRNMVRAIMGTLLEAGKNKINVDDFRQIILAKDRGRAGFSVPAHGLFLEDITYPESIWKLR